MALKHKLICENGGFFYVNEEIIRGKEALKQYLVANETVREELIAKLRERLIVFEEKEEIDVEGGQGGTGGDDKVTAAKA